MPNDVHRKLSKFPNTRMQSCRVLSTLVDCWDIARHKTTAMNHDVSRTEAVENDMRNWPLALLLIWRSG